MGTTVDNDGKYDRQLRLWANSGQSKLENSHICLINANSTGSEILKNLVLPGIGEFTIIDDSDVSAEDVSSCFFLKRQDLGSNRASAVTKHLLELNSDVKGHPVKQSLKQVFEERELIYWRKYSVVVVCEYVPQLEYLIEVLWELQVPLLIANNVGFYGSLKLVANEVTVVETHDPSKIYDLRIDKPWSELQAYSDSIDLKILDDMEHAHVPYLIIFIKALSEWKQRNDGRAPINFKEKQAFKKQIESMSRNIHTEENFIEACAAVHRALQVTQVPESIKILFEHENIMDANINSNTQPFWLYVKALQRFVDLNNNIMPLPGSLPDMASDTKSFIKLQDIFTKKASRDQQAFKEQLIKVFEQFDRPTSDISHESIRTFCKNCQLLHVSQGSKHLWTPELVKSLIENKSEFDDSSTNTLAIYFGMQTMDFYTQKFNSSPTISDLNNFLDLFSKTFSVGSEDIPDSAILVFREMLSHPAKSYHNISSLMGGVASQEILKMATRQYIPFDNLFIFDGIRSVSDKWKV